MRIRKRQAEILGDTSRTPPQNTTTTQAASSSTLPPPKNRRAAVSSDVTASPDLRPTPTASSDVRAARKVPVTSSSDITPKAKSSDVRPKQNEKVDYLYLKDLPQEAFYDPVRDKNVPQDNIVTPQQLIDIINGIRRKNPKDTAHLTPTLMAYQLYKYKGYRIKRG